MERLIADFDSLDPAVKAPSKPKYSAVHLFFTSRLPADLMKRLSQSKRTIARIRTLIELNSGLHRPGERPCSPSTAATPSPTCTSPSRRRR